MMNCDFIRDKFMDARQHRQLPRGRKGSLGLVEDVEPVSAKPMHHQRKERLTVRLLVKRSMTVGIDDRWRRRGFSVELFNLGSHIKEAFSSKKEPILRPPDALPQRLNPQLVAIASSRVDLPLPFSPTMKVTLGCSFRVPSSFTAGSENG
jgi:hypothetical protein